VIVVMIIGEFLMRNEKLFLFKKTISMEKNIIQFANSV